MLDPNLAKRRLVDEEKKLVLQGLKPEMTMWVAYDFHFFGNVRYLRFETSCRD